MTFEKQRICNTENLFSDASAKEAEKLYYR